MDKYYITDVYGYRDIHHFRRKFDEVVHEIEYITTTTWGSYGLEKVVRLIEGRLYIYLARDPDSRSKGYVGRTGYYTFHKRMIFTERKEEYKSGVMYDLRGVNQYTVPLPKNYWFTYPDKDSLLNVL